MSQIDIKEELSSDPYTIKLPDPGETTLKFKATGPGEVNVYYTIDEDAYSARFFEDDDLKAEIIREATLYPAVIGAVSHTVAIRRSNENEIETFEITAYVVPKGSSKNDPQAAETTGQCQYHWVGNNEGEEEENEG